MNLSAPSGGPSDRIKTGTLVLPAQAGIRSDIKSLRLNAGKSRAAFRLSISNILLTDKQKARILPLMLDRGAGQAPASQPRLTLSPGPGRAFTRRTREDRGRSTGSGEKTGRPKGWRPPLSKRSNRKRKRVGRPMRRLPSVIARRGRCNGGVADRRPRWGSCPAFPILPGSPIPALRLTSPA
jgi:hypothetical protein